MSRKFEIRCPIYGFIELDAWERDLVNHPVFQRLRRIRQLGWTDYVYPGAMHTRFEHSLGVMHMATMLFDNLVARSRDLLLDYAGGEDSLRRARRLVRLAALLHDVGHGPFSHAAEELMPFRDESARDRWRHEDYSASAIRLKMKDVLDDHPKNAFRIRAEEVAHLLLGSPASGRDLAWRPIVSGQLDADRMDYLLRDSHHCGVDYGHFGWQRLLDTVTAIKGEEAEGLRIGVDEGGWNAAESLIVARYMMFNQVYYHKTRVILDHHVGEALRVLLPDGQFPSPDRIEEYLGWDDWRVLGLLAEGQGGEHGRRLRERDLFKLVWASSPYPTPRERREIDRVRKLLAGAAVELSSERSWYKPDKADIRVRLDDGSGTKPLSAISPFVAKMGFFRQARFYAPAEQAEELRHRVDKRKRRGTR
ncbi:MAG: HD domain-containing protein [Geminicoccaceae bacterium]|nr:HD domain-containing protein [Geminicoccaceae bacterium]